MRSRQIQFRIKPEELKLLEAKARDEGRNRSDVVRRAVLKYLGFSLKEPIILPELRYK